MIENRNQYKFRKSVFDTNKQHDSCGHVYLVCYRCGYHINPAHEKWDADHVIPHAFGGKEGMPICKACHKEKTAKEDVPAIAKAKRVSDKHLGIRTKRGWPKRPFPKREAAE